MSEREKLGCHKCGAARPFKGPTIHFQGCPTLTHRTMPGTGKVPVEGEGPITEADRYFDPSRPQAVSAAVYQEAVERIKELEARLTAMEKAVRDELGDPARSQPRDEWGPACAGCGDTEYRIDGFCSCDCRDRHEAAANILEAGQPTLLETRSPGHTEYDKVAAFKAQLLNPESIEAGAEELWEQTRGQLLSWDRAVEWAQKRTKTAIRAAITAALEAVEEGEGK